MDGRHDRDCFATSIAWLTGEDINVLPASSHARIALDDGAFYDEVWPDWLAANGYKIYIRKKQHYKKKHLALFWVSETSTYHAVICNGDKIVYNPDDSFPLYYDKYEFRELMWGFKIIKERK